MRRGSSGYGLACQRMIYRDSVGGDRRDLASAVDYLRRLRESPQWIEHDPAESAELDDIQLT